MIPAGAILIALIFGMMMVEPEFFELGERRYSEVDKNSHTIDLGRFSVITPVAFKYVKLEGVDSFVGLITDGTDSLSFDFGWYSNDLTSQDYHLTVEQINGRKAVIGYSSTLGTAVHFPNLADDNSLTFHAGRMPKETALAIFRTIKFVR